MSLGVFLALMGEQWRENAHHREQARESLRRFKTEIVANQAAVNGVKDYHAELLKSIKAYLAADATARRNLPIRMQGVRPVFFESTAWDLALASQSLAYIDSELGYSISRVYDMQHNRARLS